MLYRIEMQGAFLAPHVKRKCADGLLLVWKLESLTPPMKERLLQSYYVLARFWIEH
jgi:hypothetical protein